MPAPATTGSPGANGLAGLIASTFNGDDGNDRIIGTDGADRLFGGDGNDVIRSRDQRADRVSCGAGFDLARVDRRDVVSGCNIVIGGRQRVRLIGKTANVARGRAVLRLRCVATRRCRGTVRLLRGRQEPGHRPVHGHPPAREAGPREAQREGPAPRRPRPAERREDPGADQRSRRRGQRLADDEADQAEALAAAPHTRNPGGPRPAGRRRCQSSVMTTLPLARPCSTYASASRVWSNGNVLSMSGRRWPAS